MERDIGPAVVEPITDAFGEVLPLLPVREHRITTSLVELGDAQSLDFGLSRDPQSFFGLDLDGEAVSIPPRDPRDLPSLHRPQPADQILDGAADDVVQARSPVRRGRTLEEHEGLSVRGSRDRHLEEILVPPTSEGFLLHGEEALGCLRISHRIVCDFG